MTCELGDIRSDVIAALGAPVETEAFQRVDVAAELYARGVAPHLVVTGGLWTLKSAREESSSNIGDAMFDYAANELGLPEGDVTALTGSRDTIGDGLVIKHFM